jgi:hypothetical protein
MNLRNLKAGYLKKDKRNTWLSGNMTVFYSSSYYHFVALYEIKKFKTMGELKKFINEFLK